MRIITALVASLSLFSVVHASDLEYRSGSQQVELIELYTSEGCSSCPPADRWLSRLKASEGLWSQFIPVAFHVDYWDYIGWQDRFAKREYSQRQRRYAAEFRESTVYTPGVRKSGYEWRAWRKANAQIPRLKEPNLAGELVLKVNQNGRFAAEFDAKYVKSDALQLNVAVLGQSLQSVVTRGENHGRTLEHDFVVLETATLSAPKQAGKVVWDGVVPTPKIQAQEYAIAAWVSEAGSQIPLQATGGPLVAAN